MPQTCLCFRKYVGLIKTNRRLLTNILSWLDSPSGPGPHHLRGFEAPLWHTTHDWIYLGEWSARRRDSCATIHNIHGRQASKPPTGFHPAIPAIQWVLTCLERCSHRDRYQTLFGWRNSLTFWRRIFFLILAHSVFKMWVMQKPNKVALWNKRHFEEEKWRLYSMFKIFSTDICWINIKWGI